jgi:hypothetical protein
LLKLKRTCFDGTCGSNIVNADGSEVASIQFQGSSPTRYAALPADTPRVEGERVCASLRGSLVQPCFYLERTNANSFRGSIAGLRSAYCDFTHYQGRALRSLTADTAEIAGNCARVGPFQDRGRTAC